jgi:ActR/RegA family two-component response regulator
MSHSSTRKNFLLINADGALRQVIDGELTEDTLALVAAGELTCVIFDTTSSPPQFATLDEEGNTTWTMLALRHRSAAKKVLSLTSSTKLVSAVYTFQERRGQPASRQVLKKQFKNSYEKSR